MSKSTKLERNQVQIKNLTTIMWEFKNKQDRMQLCIEMLEESVLSITESQADTVQIR